MNRATILSLVPCDLKRLPLGAVEAFLLSHVDGRSTLEELAEVAGLDLAEATRMARRLMDLGAVAERDHGGSKRSASLRAPAKSSKAPPRSRSSSTLARSPSISVRPASISVRPSSPSGRSSRTSTRPSSPSARPSRTSTRPSSPSARPSSASARPSSASARPSRTSARPAALLGPAPAKAPPADDVCEIDDASRTRIIELDARLEAGIDHYSLLGIERDADKKTIKRAYFTFASTFHPDKFFGKKLGKVRAPL